MVLIDVGPGTLLATPGMLLLALVLGAVCQSVLAQPSLTLGGRLDVDVAHYSPDETPLDSGWNLRRLRGEIGGGLNQNTSYYVLADFKDGEYRAQASWLRYRFDQENELYAGRIELPFSLQRVTNSQYNLFMERALPAAMTRHYGTGLVYQHKGRRWNFRGGLFGKDRLNFGRSQTFGNAVAVRFGRRIHAGNSRLWLGAGAMYQDAIDVERVRARPESSVTDRRLVDSGRLRDLEKITRVGLEGVWKKGPWSLQAEWIKYSARRTDAGNLNFAGGYVEVAHVFNGRRRFSFRSGEWMSPQVTKFKTWELAFRASHIDLQEKTVSGGRETNYSLGLNFYFNPGNRLLLNWIKVYAGPNRRGIDESPDILQARLQIGF